MAYFAQPGCQSICSPCIPFVTPISGGIRPGMSFYIRGKIHHGISRFHVNLQCGEYSGSDVAFHFNPRFDLWDKVVFNTFRNGSWEGEEKIHHMPFHRGHHFDLVIVVNPDGYQISVNGKHLHMYQHRMPVAMVGFLEIGGDVIIETININGGMPVGMGGMMGVQVGMGGMMGYPGGMAGGMGGGFPGGQMGGYYGGGGMY